MPLSDRGIAAYAVDHLGGGLLIGVAGVGVWTLSEHAAAVGRRVEHRHAPGDSGVDEWLRRAVEEGVPVVVNYRVEEPGFDVLELHGYRSTRDAEVTDDTLVAELLEDIDRSAWGHGFLERRPLLVVEIDDLDAIEAE